MSLSALATVLITQTLNDRPVPAVFNFAPAATLAIGAAYLLIPWDRISDRWLHVIPVMAVIVTAAGIKLGGFYEDYASDYYVFIALFVASVFSSRAAVAAHLVLAVVAMALPLLYRAHLGGEAAPRTVVDALLLVVAAVIVIVLREALQRRQRELEELALRDPLTGVGNYRLLGELLEYELERHRRSGDSLTVLLLDLDGFKEVNDTLGHLVGDQVLVDVAKALSRSLRAQDTIARQGGDEFSILAPETNRNQAEMLAARVQASLRKAVNGAVSASIGMATFPLEGEDATSLLALADTKLREAKQEGSRVRRAALASPEVLLTQPLV